MKDLVIGFFGQSGAGKTTIIKQITSMVGRMPTIQYTGIIRQLFQNNPQRYVNPEQLLLEYAEKLVVKKERPVIAQEIYETYIRSQLQLLNDFSTEVFMVVREGNIVPSILLFDRSPVDFYTLTVCGVNFLKSKLDNVELSRHCKYFIELTRKTAEYNSNLLLDKIIVTYPWNNNTNSLVDGVRDQYLTEFYTGNNWYSHIKDIKLNKTDVYTLKESILSLQERNLEVVNLLKNG